MGARGLGRIKDLWLRADHNRDCVMDSSVSLAAKALARSCIAATCCGGELSELAYTITPASGAAGSSKPCGPTGQGQNICHIEMLSLSLMTTQ